MSILPHIARLEQRLALLIREWERYFAGDLRVPPEKERTGIQQELRMLAEKQTPRRTEQYKLEQLQHRFMTYVQMWERMLREREEGRSRFPIRRPGAPPPPPPPAPRSQPASPNAAAAGSVKDDSGDLYQRYMAARQQTGDTTKVDASTFQNQIEAQRRKIEARLGQKVRFDVVVENGKVKLAARRTGDKAQE